MATFLATFVGVGVAFVLENIYKRRQADERAIWAARHLMMAEARLLHSRWWEKVLLSHIVRKGLHRAPVYRELGEIHPDVRNWFSHNMSRLYDKSGAVPGATSRSRAAVVDHAEAMDAALAELAGNWPPRSWRIRNLRDTILE